MFPCRVIAAAAVLAAIQAADSAAGAVEVGKLEKVVGVVVGEERESE